MKLLLKPLFLPVMIAAFALPLCAQDARAVLATNSWTAAFVAMAGGEAEHLAPSNMEHPPEYELKPSDVRKVRDADLLVYAGYEVLMKTVFENFSKPEEQMVRITTSYAPPVLEQSVLAVAEKLGTRPAAEQNIADYRREIAFTRQRLKDSGLFGLPVIVQFHQKPLVQALGFEIIGVFGPQPLEVRQIAELGRTEPALIIDNAHNPMGAPLEEILNVRRLELVNFPGFPLENGLYTPMTLTGVLKFNAGRLLE